MKDFRYLSGVSTLTLNQEACTGCGLCTIVCPHGVLAMGESRVEIVDHDGCMECGACTQNCPTDALVVTPGVGCAAAIIHSWIKGGKPACC